MSYLAASGKFIKSTLPNEITVNSRGSRNTKPKPKNETVSRDKKLSVRAIQVYYTIQFTTVKKQNPAINANPNLVKSRHHKFRCTSLLPFVVFPLLFSRLKSLPILGKLCDLCLIAVAVGSQSTSKNGNISCQTLNKLKISGPA